MATKIDIGAADRELAELNEQMMNELHLTPTWHCYTEMVPKAPKISYKPYLWKKDLLDYVIGRAGELVDLNRGGERRSFEVVNPALRHLHGTTHTIAAALQLVQPGEIAPPHRHLASAIRFIVKGRGAYTAVQGERLYMEPRDLILTPTWTWHEHGNETNEPIIWIDALDYPFNTLMQLSFFDHGGPGAGPNARPTGFTRNWQGLARPAWESYPEEFPMVTYRWDETFKTMTALRGDQGSPYDGILLEYQHPFKQAPVLPTLSCYAQMLRSGEHTKARRTTASNVFYVLEGSGHSVLDGQRFDWSEGDFFMVPPWCWTEHVADSGKDALFFRLSDKPILDSFRMYREEAHPDKLQPKPATRFTPTKSPGAATPGLTT